MASSLSSPFEIKCSHPVQPSPSFDSLFFEYLSTVRDKKFPRKSLSLSLRRGIPPYTRPRHIRPCSVNGENFYNLGRSREKVERRLKWRNIRQISHLAPAYINPLDPLFNCLSLSLVIILAPRVLSRSTVSVRRALIDGHASSNT